MLFFNKSRRKHVRRLIAAADQQRDALNPAGAANLYKVALEAAGEDFNILMQLGNSLKDSGQFSEAKSIYESASNLKPGDPDCQLQLGHLYKLMGEDYAALDSYRKSIELQSEDNPALYEYEQLHEAIRRAQPERQCSALRNHGGQEKINIFFGASREPHGWNLSLAAMRFYKKISIYNGWRR